VSLADAGLIAALVVFVYPFVIYPVVLARLARRRAAAADREPDTLPSIAMLICALNEEKIIGAKMENCLELDYPREKIRITVVSDGSTDRTAEIVRGYGAAGVRLIERAERRGKVVNLNQAAPGLDAEILVFSDANVLYAPEAVRALVARFRDPSVGCVSGKVVLTGTTEPLQASEQNYYSVEWGLQENASQLYSMAGADGAMYAVRKELFRPCPNDTIIEDFIGPIGIVRQGRRVVFEPSAVGWEKGPASLMEEFRRKVRIAAGAAQGLRRGNAWPRGAPLRFWFIFLSHKFLRWISPLVGLAILAWAAASAQSVLSRIVLAGFVLLAGASMLRLLTGWSHALLDAPFYFLFGQCALLTGLAKGFLGKQSVLWKKADR
jgi:cellulose synthase/poly-beta-1,6-N-acetylglucosamine synthase-like glycosyltransferase